jgi:hypothetical protein
MSYTIFLDQFHNIVWNIYFGGILTFSIYSLFKSKESPSISLQFKNVGVVLGLSLGFAILSKLLSHWLVFGHYYPRNTVEAIAFGSAFLLWLSNMILEIWTLDPIRKHHKGLLPKTAKPDDLEKRFLRHLWLHSIFLLSTQLSFGFI